MSRTQRMLVGGAVAVVHLLAVLLLLDGRVGAGRSRRPAAPLSVFDVVPPADPPPPVAAESSSAEPQGGAAARAAPAPVSAPRPVVRPPVPVRPATSAGGHDAAPATGAGEEGAGSGAGPAGDGSGNGEASPPRRIAGRIEDRDYPRAARRTGAAGRVIAAFTVGADGRARACRIHRSSGSADLDDTTCRLIEERFRFAPARDARGRAVEAEGGWQQDWWFDGR